MSFVVLAIATIVVTVIAVLIALGLYSLWDRLRKASETDEIHETEGDEFNDEWD